MMCIYALFSLVFLTKMEEMISACNLIIHPEPLLCVSYMFTIFCVSGNISVCDDLLIIWRIGLAKDRRINFNNLQMIIHRSILGF